MKDNVKGCIKNIKRQPAWFVIVSASYLCDRNITNLFSFMRIPLCKVDESHDWMGVPNALDVFIGSNWAEWLALSLGLVNLVGANSTYDLKVGSNSDRM